MAKDYTDFLVMILDAGERVYHLKHVRHSKKLDLSTFPFDGHTYVFNRDRAFSIRWAPWKRAVNRNPFRTFYEVVRTKRVGLLLYQEPCNKNCARCKELKDPKYIESYPNCYGKIEPIHISRVKQPSGRLVVDATKPTD